MNHDNSSSSIKRKWALRYGLAFVAVAAGFGLRVALTAWIGPGLPTYITFYPAVMVAALVAGFGPGLLATVLAGLSVAYWILPPEGFLIASPVERLGLVLFSGMGLFMSAVAELYRRDRRKIAAYDREMALRETRREKEFLADVLEHTSQPFAVGYPDGRLGLCNRAYEQLTGYSAEEMRAIDWATMLTPPEWREMEKQKLEELHRSGQPVRYEKEYIRKDGTRVPVELLVHLVKDTGGKPEYYYSFLTDITGRKRVQTVLRESEERLRFALETSHTGAWDLDLADHTAFRSLEHDRVFGYAELLPKWTYEMFLEHVLPEDRAAVDGKFRRAMENHGDWNFECRIRRTDGQVRWIWAAGRHPLDAAGATRRMAGIVQDITERKQTEEALRESEERHQLATSVAKEAIWEVNLVTGTVRWNRAYAELFGRPAEAKAHGPWWLGRIHPEDRERVDASFTKVLAEGGDSWTCDYRMKLADDSYAFLNDRAIIVRDKAGAPLRAVGAKLNVTKRKLAEEALARQRKELQVILESVPAMIFYKDKENHFVHTNKAFEDAMGLPKEKLHGQSLFDLYPKAMAEAYWNDDKEVMASRKSRYGIVEPMQTPHGTRILQTDKIPYFDESGNVIGVIGFAVDITERKQAEEALKKAHAELEVRVEERTAELHAASRYARSLLEASLDPLVTISQEGKVTDVNKATELVTGVPREQLIGTDFARYFTKPQEAEAGYEKVLAEGQVRDYPLTIRHVSGRTTDVLYHATVYRNEAGAAQGVFAAARDVTELKEAGRRRDFTNALLGLFLQRTTAKEYLNSVVEVIRQWTGCQALGIRIKDKHREITYESWTGFDPAFIESEHQLSPQHDDCAKFGFASLAIIPIRYRDEITGDIHLADRRPDHFTPVIAEFIESMSPLIGEAVHRFQTEAELAKHRDQLEELVKQRTSELERSNRDLEQFAYVASHDLQEPLRAVGGYVKLLQHRFPEKLDAKAREYVAGAADGAERMQRLIADLLAFSRVGTRGVAFSPADLNALLRDALNNLQTSIKEAGAKITSDPLPSLPVDATQIVQLFQNLIGNAIKFRSERTPEIHVGASQEKERWLFWVRDNGIGIEPQYFGRIFQIFQRLHSRKHYPGTGIGLAICKKIVERHGGEIRVESRPAQGSTFYFSIPAISAQMEPAP